MKLYGLWGAGGFAREAMPVAMQHLAATVKDPFSLVHVVDEEPRHGLLNGHEVWTTERFFAAGGEKYFNIAIASWEARMKIADMCRAEGIPPFSIFAPNSWISGSNTIGEGAIFSPFTTVTADARIGKFFHANIYSYVAHDCVIGDYVTFAPAVHCNGGTIVKDHAYIGTGAVIREARAGKPIVIGEGAIVGMGAVVTKDVAPHTTVAGNPATALEQRRSPGK